MGRSSILTTLLVLAVITVTRGQQPYYDILQGLQQLFQPYQGNNPINQYNGGTRTPTTHKQTNRQDSKKKTSEQRHQNAERRTKKPPVNQYDYVFATTQKPSRKTTKSNSSQSNSRNLTIKNQSSNILLSDYYNPYDITTKVNRIKPTTTQGNYYNNYDRTTKVNRVKPTTEANYYNNDVNRATTENVFSNNFNRPVTENLFENVNYANNNQQPQNNRKPANNNNYSSNPNRNGNGNNNREILNTDYNVNSPSLPTNNRNPEVTGVNPINKGSANNWGNTNNNRNTNNFGTTSNGFLNTDNNPNYQNNFGSNTGTNNVDRVKPTNRIPDVSDRGTNNNFGNTGVDFVGSGTSFNTNTRGNPTNFETNNWGNTNNGVNPNNYNNQGNTNFAPGPVTFLYPSDSLNHPGVRPAPVDTGLPPITNRPVTNNNFFNNGPSSYNNGPSNFNNGPSTYNSGPSDTRDREAEILIGPDEDDMSDREKRRYVEMSERMCDRYKSLFVKKVVALPLVPSPDPVELNVSDCTPLNVPLVIGGSVVSIRDFPHMALVGWEKTTVPGYSWKCGGSLISDQYILTAGHCTYQDRDGGARSGPPQAVQLGSSYLDDQGALVVKIAAVIRHPKYKQKRAYHDVAMIKMVSKVTFSEVIRPACLGVPPPEGRSVIATGWGRTEYGGDHSLELRSVSVPVWNMRDCREIWGTSRKLPAGVTPDSHVCAGDHSGGKDTCQGDSGGPAQIQDGCVWRVVAVTSYGRSCGAPRTPALYAVIPRAFVAAQVFDEQRTWQ